MESQQEDKDYDLSYEGIVGQQNIDEYSKYQFETRAIRIGQGDDNKHGAVNIPIYLSSTYKQKGLGLCYGGFAYGRDGNPTRQGLEKCISALENGKYTIVFSSGMAAITTLMMTLKSNSEVIMISDVYPGTSQLCDNLLAANYNLKFHYVDLSEDLTNLEKVINPKIKLVYIETPTNPCLTIVDIREIANICKKHKIKLAVDNTFASPYNQNPLTLGADVVIHSCTKYIGGHCDLIMGSATTNDGELHDKMYNISFTTGNIPSPFDCYLALRGIKTLKVRMEEASKNALIIAQYLEQHKKVEKVVYPGLESHPQYEIAKKQMRTPGAMITFYIKGKAAQTEKMLTSLELIILGESLGGVESLIQSPPLMTGDDERKEGIIENQIRFSVGIENVDDLIRDLELGLSQI